MKSITKYSLNKLLLEDTDIATDDYTVKYRVLNELGQVALDNEDNPIENKDAEFDDTLKRYCTSFQLSSTSKGKYYRLVFDITDADGIYIVSNYALVNLIIESNSIQLVPNEYFRDYTLNANLIDEFRQTILAYPDDAVKELLLSATGQLQTDCEMSFTPKTIENEAHDWFQDNLRETSWMIQFFNYPIISVQSYQLYFGTSKVVEIPTEYLLLEKIMGTVEYLPAPNQPFFLIFQNLGIESTQLQLFSRGLGAPRLPAVFRISYTYGIDFMNIPEEEQAEIRLAIARRALLNGLGSISPAVLNQSVQKSVDGASYGVTRNGFAYLQELKGNEKDWVETYKRRYNKHIKMITA
jgi:hypothetical protein